MDGWITGWIDDDTTYGRGEGKTYRQTDGQTATRETMRKERRGQTVQKGGQSERIDAAGYGAAPLGLSKASPAPRSGERARALR